MNPLYRKISRRLIPFLMLLYLVAFLDRVNISFAALTMNRDLHISSSLFGLAAGMFFFGYFLFEVPSNLILLRVGARRWIMVLMVLWGLLSVSTAFVPNSTIYIVMRFLLGSAEAGFFPGVILYLTFWLPPSVRSSVTALLVTAVPLSNMIGSPISARLLELNNTLGLKGWQWLFLMEGAPAILLGTLVLFLLPDKPADVSWLSADEKLALERDLRQAEPAHTAPAHSILDVFTARPVVYAWSFAYFCMAMGLYGLGFWIPTVLASHGLALRSLGWATALPYLAAIIGMVLWCGSSDRDNERRFHLVGAFLTAGAGFLLAAFAPDAALAIAGFSLAAIGVLSVMPMLWTASTIDLAGPLVAAHIAVINSIGNLGGFFGPIMMGWMRQVTHHYVAGLACIAAFLLIGALASAKLCKPSTIPLV